MLLKAKRPIMVSAMILSLVITGVSFGQTPTHFKFTSNTGYNMSVMVPIAINPTINGAALQNGDEIGAFTPGGLCVGAGVWTGQEIYLLRYGVITIRPTL